MNKNLPKMYSLPLLLTIGSVAVAQDSKVIVSGGGQPSPASGNVVVSGGAPPINTNVVTGVASSLTLTNTNRVGSVTGGRVPGLGSSGPSAGQSRQAPIRRLILELVPTPLLGLRLAFQAHRREPGSVRQQVSAVLAAADPSAARNRFLLLAERSRVERERLAA